MMGGSVAALGAQRHHRPRRYSGGLRFRTARQIDDHPRRARRDQLWRRTHLGGIYALAGISVDHGRLHIGYTRFGNRGESWGRAG